jgi:seryl-tRNA synthetase
MFIFSDPEKSWADYEELTKTMEKIFQQLGIHYRLMNMSGGDIGAPNAKKLDLEAWFPAQKQYRELTSCSHDTDFQARRLNIKYQGAGGKDFVHTMNSTAVAIGRTIIAIAENYQQKDGSIKIPKVLIPYCGFDKINKRSK